MRLSVTAAALCLVVVACGDSSSVTQTPTDGASPLGIAEPSADQASEPAPTEASQPKPPTLPIKFTNVTRKVPAGGNASVSIKTKKGARCSIDVQYDSGSSTAAGLGSKRAAGDGGITWTWTVGANTHRGTYPIDVFCKDGDRQGDRSTRFAVR